MNQNEKTEIETPANSSSRWWACLQAVVLFTVVLCVYIPTYSCGYIWDDDDYILENRAIQASDGIARIWFEPKATPQYYPLVHSLFWCEHQIWGLNPGGYHVVNVILHAVNSLLAWRITLALQIPGGWLIAAVFAVHPVHVESVSWITERKNVLSGLCYLSALLLILPIFDLDNERLLDQKKKCYGRYLLATLFFVGALLSKSVTCSLPAACLLIAYWKRGQVTRRDVMMMLPWFAMGVGAAVNTAWIERSQVGASGQVFPWTFLERCWIAGNAVWFYLGKLLWPNPLVFFYPRWEIQIQSPWSWFAPIAAVLLPIALWRFGSRFGRGPLVACLFFGGTLLPALGFVNVYPMRYTFVADHYQYLGSLGPIAVVIGGLAAFTKSIDRQWGLHVLGSLLILMPLMMITWHRQAVYRNVETLWTDVLAKNPNSFAAHFHLGKVCTAQGRHDQATAHFRESLRLQTDDSETYITLSLLGNSLARQGQFDEADACLRKAHKQSPNDWEIIHGLATLAARQSRHREAIELFERVIQLQPNHAIVRLNLGNAYASAGDLPAAMTVYETALKLKPDLADAQLGLANVFARQGRFVDAERAYLKVLEKHPDHSQAKSNLLKVRAALSNDRPGSK